MFECASDVGRRIVDDIELGPAEGFNILETDASSFDALIGPKYMGIKNGVAVIAFRVDARHLNELGTCHGGAIAALADVQAIPAMMLAGLEDRACPTISLNVDYLAPVLHGRWVEMHTLLLRRTRTMLFTQGLIYANGELVARTNAIYKIGPFRALSV